MMNVDVQMQNSEEKYVLSKGPSVWDRFVAWCIGNSIQSRLDLTGGVLSLVVVVSIVVVCAFKICDLDKVIKHPVYLLLVASIPVIQFFNSYLANKGKRQQNKLSEELEKCRTRILELEPLYNSLEENFGVWSLYILKTMRFGNDSRASFYLYDDRGGANDKFRIVSRESMDPMLKRKGRLEFPTSQGVIGKSWTENQSSFFCSDKVSEVEYDEMMAKELGADLETAKNLTMRACTIMGHVILNSDNRKIGVVIVESISSVKKKDRKKAEKNLSNIVDDVSPSLSQLFATYADFLLNQESPKEIAE